jgi:hypothetical protein
MMSGKDIPSSPSVSIKTGGTERTVSSYSTTGIKIIAHGDEKGEAISGFDVHVPNSMLDKPVDELSRNVSGMLQRMGLAIEPGALSKELEEQISKNRGLTR